MKCENCGFESHEDFICCENCGTAVTNALEPSITPIKPTNPVEEMLLPVFRDKLFMVICILLTVSCAASIVGGGMPVINILIAIFLWLTYAKAQKGIASHDHLRCVSGAVYANYVVTNVASGILIVCGIIISISFQFITDNEDIMSEIMQEIELEIPKYLQFEGSFYSILGIVFGIIFVLIAAIMLVFNLLGMRKIHRFAKSVYRSIEQGMFIFENPYTVKNWLVFFAVCSAISTLGSLGGGLIAIVTSLCSAATIIIAIIMINKYFLQPQPVTTNNQI